jgi:octanoyl-[GcvH]:protein N-octanoyltransferase
VRDRPAAESADTPSCIAAPAPKGIDAWQVIVAESAAAAHWRLRRQHDLADEIGARIRGPVIFIWRSQPALIVTRGQTRWPDFEAAGARLAEMGWPVLVRMSGGGAFPISPGTVQIAMIARHPCMGHSMEAIYSRLGSLIASALAEIDILARFGETPGTFCNGRHDLVVADRKIAGLAQHWRHCADGGRCITASASVLVDADIDEFVRIVDRFNGLCERVIDIRADTITTVRDHCAAAVRSQRNLATEFSFLLAAAARRGIRTRYS